MKNKYDNKSKLLFSDTGNLMYQIKTEHVCEHLSSDKEILILVIIRLSQNSMIIQTN